MKNILIAIVVGLTFASALKAEENQALVVTAPATWEVKFKGEKGRQFYTAKRKEGDTALLMFSRWPVPGNVKQIPEQIDMLAKMFVAQVKENKELKLKTTDYKVEEIEGEAFSGKFVRFEIAGGLCQTMFMVGDSEGIWNGQFTGTDERWAEALIILKTMKKR